MAVVDLARNVTDVGASGRQPAGRLARSPTGSRTLLTAAQRDLLRFDANGLIPAVVQDHDTGEVLMVAWMDAAALERTVESGEAVFYSRSRQEQWHKGATSGNTQRVVELRVDCDGDVLLLLVDPQGDGVACHTGERSCFHRHLPGGPTGPAAAAPPLADR